MIVQFGHPSPWHVGQSSRRLYSARSVGIGTSPRRWAVISSNSGPTPSYSFPSSAPNGAQWKSTSSIAIFGTSGASTRRSAHTHVDRVDALLLRGIGHALGRLHGGVRRRLVLRGLHDHAARRLRDRLRSGDVGQRDDDVVVRRVDVGDPPAWHRQASLLGPGGGPGVSGPGSSSGPSSAPPAAGGGVGIWPVCRTGWRSLEIAERSSYVMPFSSVRLTRIPGIVTRRPAIET